MKFLLFLIILIASSLLSELIAPYPEMISQAFSVGDPLIRLFVISIIYIVLALLIWFISYFPTQRGGR